MFTLLEAISWVGKQAQLNTNTLSLWEGWQLIAQAITEWHAETMRPGCPHSHLPALLPFRFCNQDGPYRKRGSRVLMNAWRSLGILVRCHTMTKTRYHNVVWTMARCNETHGLHWLWHLHLHQIMGLRVTKLQCQLLHQCHQGLIDLGAPGICTMASFTGSQEAIWKSICQSSRIKTRRTLSLIKVGIGI